MATLEFKEEPSLSEIKSDLSAYGCSHMYTNDREKNVIMMQCHPYVRRRCGGSKHY